MQNNPKETLSTSALNKQILMQEVKRKIFKDLKLLKHMMEKHEVNKRKLTMEKRKLFII